MAAGTARRPDGRRRRLLGEHCSNWQRAGPQQLAGAQGRRPGPGAGTLRLLFRALFCWAESEVSGLTEQQAQEDPSREQFVFPWQQCKE